jgi:hypothetical protein
MIITNSRMGQMPVAEQVVHSIRCTVRHQGFFCGGRKRGGFFHGQWVAPGSDGEPVNCNSADVLENEGNVHHLLLIYQRFDFVSVAVWSI